MIRPSYAFKLARTKLRSKRGVLITSMVVASLLFAALIAIVIIFSGAEKSATEFIKKAGNDQYLVKTTPNIPYTEIGFTQPPTLEVIRAIKAMEKSYYQELRDTYKSLGIEYDASTEISGLMPSAFASESLPEEERVLINWSSPVIDKLQQQKAEAYAKTATNRISDLKEIAQKYGASGYYIVGKGNVLPVFPGVRLIQNNKENFADSELKSGDMSSYGYYINAVHNSQYSLTDQSLLGRYLLTTRAEDLKGVPVVVSAQEAASLFGQKVGIEKEPQSPSETIPWLRNVQEKLNGHTYQACYRNATEQAMLDKIQRDYVEMKTNETTEGYKKPSLLYQYPSEPCGDITIAQDTRTASEKQAEAKAQELQKKLGTYVAPSHRLITFQIVGVKYAQRYTDYTKSIDAYVKNLLSTQGEVNSIDIPIQLYNDLPEALKIDDITAASPSKDPLATDDFSQRVLQFSSVDDARTFLDNETCPILEEKCDKKFKAAAYGSNYLLLDEIGKAFGRVAAISFPIVLGVAAVIVWFTTSRIMTENRKEIAVYRAMGAKRGDVASIYLTYIVLFASQVAFFSLLFGGAIAIAIDYFYGAILADTATAAFGILDDAPKISLVSFDSPLVLVVVGSIFAISLIASIQPLVRNVMRSPIRDMREE